MSAEHDAAAVTYLPGTWVAMAGDGGWALIDVEPFDPVVSSLWEFLRTDGRGIGLESLATVVTRDGRGGFGFVTRTEYGISVALAGEVVAVLAVGDERPDPDSPAHGLGEALPDDLALGRGAAAVPEGGSPVTLRCPPAVRWAVFTLAHLPRDLQLCASEAAGPIELPLAAGIVPASRLSIRWAAGGALGGADTTALDVSEPAGSGASPAEASPAGSAEIEGRDVSEASTAPKAERGRATARATGADAGPATPFAGTEHRGGVMPAPLAIASDAPSDAGETTRYDYLFGDTVMRTVEEAAVRAVESDAMLTGSPSDEKPASATRAIERLLDTMPADLPPADREPTDERSKAIAQAAASSSSGPSQPLPAPPLLADAPREPSLGLATLSPSTTPPPAPSPTVPPPQQRPPLEQAANSGMIEAVPWAAPLRRATSGGDDVGQEPDLELTVTRAPGMTNVAPMGGSASRPPILGPTVQAVYCLRSHPNPVQQERCRICGGEIEDRTPVTISRPVLGILRLPGGDPIVLDRSAIIGREPTPGRLVDGETAHAVKVPRSETEISRMHLEVRLEGWHVLVTDLNSVNGTTIARPGAAPERLRPNEPTLIEPGTSLTLADQFTIVFEGAP